MATVGKLQVKITADAGELDAGLRAAIRSVGTFGASVESMVRGAGRAMVELGKTAAGMGFSAAAAGLAGSVVAGASFEKQMSKVRGITGASAETMAELVARAKDLGGKTTFGPTGVAQGLTLLTKSGMDAGKALEALPGLLNLATVGDLDLAKSADIGAQTLQQFGLKAAEMSRVADVLAKASKTSTTTVAELAEGLNYVGPTASAAGMDLESVVSTLQSLAEQGIRGSAAGTGLKSMLTGLAHPSAEAAAMLKTLGVKAADSEGNLKSMPRIVEELSASMAGLPTADKLEAVSTIFGKRNTAPVSALMGFGADRMRGYEDTLRHSGGTAEKMAGVFTDNTESRFHIFLSKLAVLGTNMFEVIQPGLERLISGASAAFNGLGAMMGPVVAFIGKSWDYLAPKIGAALATAAGYIGDFIGWLQPVFAPAWEAISGAVGMAADVIDQACRIIGSAFRATLADPFTFVRDLIVNGLTMLGVAFKNWQTVSELVGLKVAGFFVTMGNEIVHVFTEVIPKSIAWFVEGISKAFVGLGQKVADAIQGVETTTSIGRIYKDRRGGPVIQGEEIVQSSNPFSGFSKGPQIEARVPGALEDQYAREIERLQTKLGSAFANALDAPKVEAALKAGRNAKELADGISGWMAGLFDTVKPGGGDFNGMAEPVTHRLQVAGEERKGAAALIRGDKDAYSAIAAFERAGNGVNDPMARVAKTNEQIAKNTAAAAKALEDGNKLFQSTKDTIALVDF